MTDDSSPQQQGQTITLTSRHDLAPTPEAGPTA